MAVPTIDPESSVLSYPQWVEWEHQFSASGAPYGWEIASGAFPSGMMFQPATAVLGEAGDDTFTSAGHGFVDGTVLVFSVLNGGSGLNMTTRYYVINATEDTFQLSTSPGGAVSTFTTDITSGSKVVRPGYAVGAGVVPGISTVRLVATNGDGDSAEVLFTIGIEPSVNSVDGVIDYVWDLATGKVSQQLSSVVTPAPAAENADDEKPIILAKKGDDLLVRLRFLKGTTFVDLNADVEDGNVRLVVKEVEPEGVLVASDDWIKAGSGSTAAYMIHAKLEGTGLDGVLSTNEGDTKTSFNGLAEFEITYANTNDVGPALLVLTSQTFRIRIDRDLATNPTS